MQAFELDDVGREQAARGRFYYEFLREPSLSMGLYRLPAGGTDPQGPHTEDEIYYVASGAATIRVGTKIVWSVPAALFTSQPMCRTDFTRSKTN